MTLAPRERQALAGIEEALRSSDPALAAKLATFYEVNRDRRIPQRPGRSFWRQWARPIVAIGVVLAGVALSIILLALVSQSGHGRSSGSCGGAVACWPMARSGPVGKSP